MSRERYLLSNDAPEAMDRFTAFTTLFDPATFRHLDGLGLAPGWRCWEVGAGGTSVVDYLSERVGPTGHVLATDINLSWTAAAGTATAAASNVEILEHDVATGPPPGAPFDLVLGDLSRVLFELFPVPIPRIPVIGKSDVLKNAPLVSQVVLLL